MNTIQQTLNGLNYSKEKLENGKIQLTIEVEGDRFEKAKDKVYTRLSPHVEIKGFRPGMAPKNLIIARLGPTLFEETLSALLPECTLEIIQHDKLFPLDQIEYAVEKVAEGTGVTYKAVFSTFPEFTLPDISKIKVKKEKVKVEDKEVDAVITQMYTDDKAKKSADTAKDLEHQDIDKKDSDKSDTTDTKEQKTDIKDIPDEWVTTIGMDVKTIKELQGKVREELERQKMSIEEGRYIDEVVSEIVSKCTFDTPRVLIEEELTRKENEYKGRIQNLGMSLDDFLRNQKTTLEDLRKQWKTEGEKQIRSEIVLMKVADTYSITVEEVEIDQQISGIQDEKIRQQYQNPEARRYIQNVLFRQKIIKKVLDMVKG